MLYPVTANTDQVPLAAADRINGCAGGSNTKGYNIYPNMALYHTYLVLVRNEVKRRSHSQIHTLHHSRGLPIYTLQSRTRLQL